MTDNKLVTELENGNVTITDGVFRTIANIATEQVAGVNSLSGGITENFVEIFNKKNHTKGVRVEDIDNKIYIHISVVVNFGTDIQVVAESIQKSVKEKVEMMTGVDVAGVDIEIANVRTAKKKEVSEDE